MCKYFLVIILIFEFAFPIDFFNSGYSVSTSFYKSELIKSENPINASIVDFRINTPYEQNSNGMLRINANVNLGLFSFEESSFIDSLAYQEKKNIISIGSGFKFSFLQLFFLEANNNLLGSLSYMSKFTYSLGATTEILSLPIDIYVGKDFHITSNNTGNMKNLNWTGISLGMTYYFNKKQSTKPKWRKNFGRVTFKKNITSSADADEKGGVSRPGATGSSEIDNFVTSTFDLNDKIVDLKAKLESVSSGLSKSNAVLTDIGNSESGPVGWAMMELQKGIAKSKNNIIASAQSLQSDVPDLPEIYFDLIKESLIAPQTLAELAKGTQPEDALLLTFNKKADEKGIPTTSKDWIMGLNLDLDPTKTLRTKLGTIKDGVMGGKDKLASVPDDLKDIGSQAQALLSSATELPKAAKSLGLKAPKALKAIKATTDALKNIPNEVKSIGDETKKVIEEVDQVLKNIQSILS